jgi:predicted nucleic acid-binding protein
MDLKAALAAAGARGNLAFAAQIAALCVRHGASLLTADRDFARFSIQVLAL